MYVVVNDSDRCPCGSGDAYGACCGPIVAASRLAPTAKQLMRSRYTASAVGDVEHLLRTWHPEFRPNHLTLDPGIRWVRLDILATWGGGPFDQDGTVHFLAHYRDGETRGRHEERSRFVRDAGTWLYVDGEPAAP